MTTSSPTRAPATNRSDGPLYRAVWRWHFFAGILVAPFATFLAITGALYLWQPQYEAHRYAHLLTTSAATAPAMWPSADAQLAAAIAAAPPHSQPQSFQPAFASGETTQVTFTLTHRFDSEISNPKPEIPPPAHHAATTTVFVDPSTARVLGQLRDDERLMNTVKKLHSSLLLGKSGEYLVELAATWTIVLLATGLYLAWPRPRFSAGGFLYPRLRSSGRTFLRDLHVVPAVWCAFASLFLLTTGLLWTNSAGAWYRKISSALGQGSPRESVASAHRSELVGWSPPLASGLAEKIDDLRSTPPPAHNHLHVHTPANDTPASLPLDEAIAIARRHELPEPFVIGLPLGSDGVYSIISDRTRPFDRAYLHLDRYSGRVLAHLRFEDFGFLAQFFSWGIVAHEGRLFGLANQILGSLATLGIVLLAVSGVALWWQRRPAGTLAAPESSASLPRSLLTILLVLSALLPLLAASLITLFLFEKLLSLLRRLSPSSLVS